MEKSKQQMNSNRPGTRANDKPLDDIKKESGWKRAGDAVEKIGDKIEHAGMKKLGDAVEKFGDKIEHHKDKKRQ